MADKFTFEVTDENAGQMYTAACEIREDIDALVRKVERFPLEMQFAGYRYVLSGKMELLEMLDALEAAVDKWAEKP